MPETPQDIRIREADFDDADDLAAVRRLVEAFADVSEVELTPTVRDTVAPFLGRAAAFRAQAQAQHLPAGLLGHAAEEVLGQREGVEREVSPLDVEVEAIEVPPFRLGRAAAVAGDDLDLVGVFPGLDPLAVEALVKGRTQNDETADLAGATAIQGATPLNYNHFKMPLMENLVKRAVRNA